MTETVHTGEGGRKSKAPRWQFVIVLVVVFVLACGAGVLIRFTMPKDQKQTVRPRRDLPVVVDDVQNLRIGGSPEEANKKIDEALKDSSTSDYERYLLLIQKGIIEVKEGRIAEGIAYYKQAADIKMDYQITSLLGDTYAKAGDSANAIIWYKKAIPLVDTKNNPLYIDDIATLKDNIQKLGGQP